MFGVLASVALSGCGYLSWPFYGAGSAGSGGDAPTKVKVSTPYSGTETELPGRVVTQTGGGNFAITNRRATGTYSVTLPTRVDIPKGDAGKSGGGIKTVTGRYFTQLNGTYTNATNTGQFTGLEVVKFDKTKLGTACLELNVTTVPSGNTSTTTGTFNLIGGTKEAKTSRFSGTYTETATNAGGGNATFTGNLTGKLRFNKSSKPLSDACKAIAAQF